MFEKYEIDSSMMFYVLHIYTLFPKPNTQKENRPKRFDSKWVELAHELWLKKQGG